MDSLRLGVIGFGNMGTAHCANVYDGKVPRMTLGAICDIAPERLKVAKERYPDVPVYDNYMDLIKSGNADVIIIAVPHYFHPEIAIAGFENGLNVITEKPAGVYTKQVIEMNAKAEQSDKLFGIMFNQRTNPIYAKIREMVKSGELGAIKRINWIVTDWYRAQAYHDSNSWRSTWKTEGGGTLINQNPHQLDLWQWMFGMPDKITSNVSYGKYYNIEVEDDVTAFFEYDNGITGVYITSTGETPGTNRLEIACDMGRIVVEDNKIRFDKNKISEREFNKTFNGVFGQPEYETIYLDVPSDGGEQHVGILKNFTEAVLDGKPLLAPGDEGIFGLTISNSIHYSSWTGTTVNTADFPHDDFYKRLKEKADNSKVVKNVVQKTADTEGTY